MNTSRENKLCAALLLALLPALLAGCQESAAAPAKLGGPASPDPTDAFAHRLHDLCGQLLLYYAAHKELPQRLDELNPASTGLAVTAACPVSGKPYVYNPQGVEVPGRSGVLILYDAGPYHAGMRWAILSEPRRPGQPLVLRVIQLPENAAPWLRQAHP